MTQLDSQSTEIDGVTYTVTMLDPLTANDLLVDIAHIIGPSLGAGAGAFASILGKSDEEQLDTEANPEMLDRAISGFFERVTKQKMREIIGILSTVTTIQVGDKTPCLKVLLAAHFKGKLGKMYEWLAFALKVQLGDFFSSALPAIELVAPLARVAVSPSQSSPSTSSEQLT
jgi:hypothetical protein